MPKGLPPASPKEMVTREILAQLHKAVTSHYHAIAQDFENFDTMRTNTVSRDELRAVCTRHVQILTDEQVRPRSVRTRSPVVGAGLALPRDVKSPRLSSVLEMREGCWGFVLFCFFRGWGIAVSFPRIRRASLRM